MFIRTEAFSQGSTLSALFGWWWWWWGGVWVLLFVSGERKKEQGDTGMKPFEGRWQQECESGSVHRHALPQISSGIQPFLLSDYLLLSTKACFGCIQPAYCQLSEPTFRVVIRHKGRGHGRIICFVHLASVPVCRRKWTFFSPHVTVY